MVFIDALRFFDSRCKVSLTWDLNPRPSEYMLLSIYLSIPSIYLYHLSIYIIYIYMYISIITNCHYIGVSWIEPNLQKALCQNIYIYTAGLHYTILTTGHRKIQA